MAGDFDDVFGGVGTRCGEEDDDNFVDDVAVIVAKSSDVRAARLWREGEEAGSGGEGGAAGETNDAEASAA